MVEMQAEVLGVYVGKPQLIGETRRGPVESAIAKAPVEDAVTLELGPTSLAGDRQADLTVHGGPDKAVYAYPSESYAGWQADGFVVSRGGMGENLTLAGVTEHDVHVGDVWRWGSALVQVSQPRAPCYKLSLHTGRKDIGPRMIATGRSGWYLRVLEPGTVPARGLLTLVERPDGAATVHDTFKAMFFGSALDTGEVAATEQQAVVEQVLATPALAESWRTELAARQPGGQS